MAEETLRQEIIDSIYQRLGGGVVEVHMSHEQYQYAVDKALKVYRQRAENSTEESIAFLTLQENVQEYILPSEIMEVRQIFRRGFSQSAARGQEIDPFSIAYTNTYLLQAGRSGGILTYELYSQYLETAGKMFGMYINFVWDHRTRKLSITQLPRGEEEVMLWCWNRVPEEVLFSDTYARPWLEDYALAEAKEIEGQIRGKFAQFAGPSGGTTLNGAELKAEAQQEKEKLLDDLKNYIDGSTPLSLIIG